jgi:putative membrane protein
MKRKFLLAAAAPLALAGCAANMNGGMGATPSGSMAMAGDMTPEDRMNYVRLAAASDMFEIQSSQMALSRAQSPAVRQYAQMLVTHHTQTTQQLMAAAQASGMSPPPMTPLPIVQRMLGELQRASGANFDRVYLTQQVPAHEMALALHSNYSQRGDTPALRTVAGAAVPIVQQHLDEARRMRAGM